MIKNIRFFNKVFIVYAVIIITALFLLAQIISGNVTSSSVERDIRYNKLVLYNITSIFQLKFEVITRIVKKAYYEISPGHNRFEILEAGFDGTDLQYLEMRKQFISYIESNFGEDPDITGITTYKSLNDTCLLISKHYQREYAGSEYKYPQRLEQFKDFSPQVRVYPAYRPDYLQDKYVYTLSMNIKTTDTYNNIGILMVDFDTNGITGSITNYYEEIFGCILILTSDGSVIYDSSGRYYGKKYPYYGIIKSNVPSGTIDGQECLINTETDNYTGITTAGIIPKEQALKKLSAAKREIFWVSFLCILVVLLLTYMITSIFSKRIKLITSAMKKARSGHLSERIHVGKSRDELAEIARDFNSMCDDIEDYIDKVYMSDIKRKDAEIRQKNAELVALQAQINPHFLYNTLEAIRMKALTSGAAEAGEMILIMSKLFRNAVKEDTITDIREELESSKLYLDLFKIRFGDRLTVRFKADNDILDYGIIRHIIQPVIENYILHGFDSSNADNAISIEIRKESDYITIEIADNGKGIDPRKLEEINKNLESFDIKSKGNIGLVNVNERIRIIYGHNCGLEISSRKNEGTTVKLRIAAMLKRELKEFVQSADSR